MLLLFPPQPAPPSAPSAPPMASGGQHLYARRKTKHEICEAYLAQLAKRDDLDCSSPEFKAQVRAHFDRLPTRYALDVNIQSLDVLSHKRLLDEARADPTAVSFAVRPVEIMVHKHSQAVDSPSSPPLPRVPRNRGHLPKPAFGSSPNLQALALEAAQADWIGPGSYNASQDDQSSSNHPDGSADAVAFYEITVASIDQPKLLSRLSEALSDLGLNIREAHAFNTSDRFSLDVFVVDQLQQQPLMNIEEMLSHRLSLMPPPPLSTSGQYAAQPAQSAQGPAAGLRLPQEPTPQQDFLHSMAPTRPASPAVDDWEIDITQLQIDAKVASGAFSNLYRGSYCGQEVAVKILKDVQDDTSQYQEFLQEVSIMRKVRHKNVVQFIGACTRKPNLCIVFEFMSGGSVYDYIRREGPLHLSQILKTAVDVSRGMDYLHQRKIIHRDLKAANLLMDDHAIVKIADFGVARVIEGSGAMTAETGTYRWMAPEVIEHKPYDTKADVFSFAVVIWELLTCKVPYSDMTPLQAAVGVVQKGLRPGIPPNCPPALADLMRAAWAQEPQARPSFRDLTPRLQGMYEASKQEEARQQAAAAMAASTAAMNKSSAAGSTAGGLLAKLRGR
ncbi:kinase-like domain-containing protein [Haematococcus lacustris]